MPEQRPTYTLTIRAGPRRPGGPDEFQRLRRLLKSLLRGYGFEAIDVREVKQSKGVENDGSETRTDDEGHHAHR